MTRKTGAVLAALLAALVAVQHCGLERQPETKVENSLRNLPDVSAGDMLSTYVASLFFGAFRAVAIDVLWIQLKKSEEERRWYERREILMMISYLQPRNPEVWSHLGWHSAYNVANGFTDDKKSWDWIRFGLTWLRKGVRMLPDNPHLKFELAFTLLHKPSWREAELDLTLLRKIEGDASLQRDLLPDDVKAGDAPRSAFELSRLWLERAKADIRKGGTKPHKTQMGLYIYLSSLDGYMRKAYYLDAIRAWQEGDTDLALRRLATVLAHVKTMLETAYPEGPISTLYKDWEGFYAALPEAVALHGKARRTGSREDELAALRALQNLIARGDQPLDEGFVWSRSDAKAPLNALKRRVAGEADAGEFNDGWLQGTDVVEGTLTGANIAPAGLDVDWYWLRNDAPRVERGERPADAPPAGLKLKILFARPEGSGVELKVTIADPLRRDVRTVEVRGKAEIVVPADRYGIWSMKVEPLNPAAPPAPDTRYFFQYSFAR
jgi:hypothetical protein